MVTKGSLINTSITNPYIELIDIPNYACSTTPFNCKFAIHENYLALVSPQAMKITVINQDTGDIIFNQQLYLVVAESIVRQQTSIGISLHHLFCLQIRGEMVSLYIGMISGDIFLPPDIQLN